jgi:hypothetical protein
VTGILSFFRRLAIGLPTETLDRDTLDPRGH